MPQGCNRVTLAALWRAGGEARVEAERPIRRLGDSWAWNSTVAAEVVSSGPVLDVFQGGIHVICS